MSDVILAALLFYFLPLNVGAGVLVVTGWLWRRWFAKEETSSQERPKGNHSASPLAALSHALQGRPKSEVSASPAKKTDASPAPWSFMQLVACLSWLAIPFALGTIIMFVTALLLLPNLEAFFVTLTVASLMAVLFNLIHAGVWLVRTLRSVSPKTLFRPLLQLTEVFTVTTVLTALVLAIWLYKSPYPLNWDLYEHQTLVNAIFAGRFSYFTTQITDTFGFNSYPPVFHTLMTASQVELPRTPLNILNYWQVTAGMHAWLCTLASFLLGYALTKRRLGAYMSAVTGALFFDSIVSFTNLFLLPQTLSALVFILAFTYLLAQKQLHRVPSWSTLVIMLLFLPLSHYVIGSLATAMFLVSFLYLRFTTPIQKFCKTLPLVELLVLAMVGGVLLSYFLDLGFLNQGEAASYAFTLPIKTGFAMRVYGFGLFLLLPLGLIALLKRSTPIHQLVGVISFGFVAILFSQFPYMLKFYVIGRFFFHTVMAIGWIAFIERMQFRPLQWLTSVVLVVPLALVLIMNSVFWKHDLFDGQSYTHLNQLDIQAAEFLQKNYGSTKTLLISDPSTKYYLEGLSGANSAGGAFANVKTRQLLSESFTKQSSTDFLNTVNQINDRLESKPQKRLLVLSGRYFLWQNLPEAQKSSFDYNIWASKKLTIRDIQFAEKVMTQWRYTPVFANEQYVIFELPNQ